jgi:hypothetical protein
VPSRASLTYGRPDLIATRWYDRSLYYFLDRWISSTSIWSQRGALEGQEPRKPWSCNSRWLFIRILELHSGNHNTNIWLRLAHQWCWCISFDIVCWSSSTWVPYRASLTYGRPVLNATRRYGWSLCDLSNRWFSLTLIWSHLGVLGGRICTKPIKPWSWNRRWLLARLLELHLRSLYSCKWLQLAHQKQFESRRLYFVGLCWSISTRLPYWARKTNRRTNQFTAGWCDQSIRDLLNRWFSST